MIESCTQLEQGWASRPMIGWRLPWRQASQSATLVFTLRAEEPAYSKT